MSTRLLTALAMAGSLFVANECFAQRTGGTTPTSGGTNLFGGTTRGTGGAQQPGGAGQQLGTTNLNAGDGSLGAEVANTQFAGQRTQQFVGQTNRSGAGGNAAALSPQFGTLGRGTQPRQTQRTTQTQRKQMRPQLRIGFSAPAIVPALKQASLTQRMASLPALATRAPGMDIQIDETGTVTLSGQVKTEHDRKLLAAIIRLEPGVRAIRNELQVAE